MQEPIVPIPEGFQVFRENGNLVVLRKWWHFKYIFMAFFVLAWDAFLVLWYKMALGNGLDGPFSWIMFVFPVLHVAVGLFLTYSTIAGFINKTITVIGQGSLSITHDPLWWPGNKSYPSADIDQIFIKRDEGENSSSFSVWMINHMNESKEIIGSLENKEYALYFEYIIEKELNIKDRPVQGEAKNRSRDGFIS